MTNSIETLKRTLIAVLYALLLFVGGTVPMTNPSSLPAVPLVLGAVALAAHAFRTERLRQLGYAAAAFLAVVVVLTLLVGATAAVGAGASAGLPVSDPVTGGALTLLLVGCYALVVHRGEGRTRGATT